MVLNEFTLNILFLLCNLRGAAYCNIKAGSAMHLVIVWYGSVKLHCVQTCRKRKGRKELERERERLRGKQGS